MDEPPQVPGESGAPSKRGSSLGEDEEFIQDDDEDEAPSAARARKAKAKKEPANGGGRRRSGRASLKRPFVEPEPSRGERRSARRSTLGSVQYNVDQVDETDYRPAKRSRMSSVGSSLTDTGASGPAQASAGIANMTINGANGAVAVKGASAIKPTEKVLDTVPGKKRSKACGSLAPLISRRLISVNSSGSTPLKRSRLPKMAQRHRMVSTAQPLCRPDGPVESRRNVPPSLLAPPRCLPLQSMAMLLPLRPMDIRPSRHLTVLLLLPRSR